MQFDPEIQNVTYFSEILSFGFLFLQINYLHGCNNTISTSSGNSDQQEKEHFQKNPGCTLIRQAWATFSLVNFLWKGTSVIEGDLFQSHGNHNTQNSLWVSGLQPSHSQSYILNKGNNASRKQQMCKHIISPVPFSLVRFSIVNNLQLNLHTHAWLGNLLFFPFQFK